MKASKKLITASVALVAALAVSVGSTFAWFTTSEYLTVSGISANVTTTESNVEVRQVRSNGDIVKPWADSLSLDLSKETANFEFDALSSEDGAKTLYNRVNYGTQIAEGEDPTVALPNGGASAEAINKGFLEIYLEFRTTEENLALVLANGSTVTAIDGLRENIEGWEGVEDIYGTKVTEGEIITASAADAMRVGFLNYTGYTEGANINASAEGLTKHGVWAPNEAKLSGDSTDGSDLDNEGLADRGRGYWQNNLAKDYEGYLQEEGRHGDTLLDDEYDLEDLYTQPGYDGIQEDYTKIVELTDDFTAFQASYAEAADDDGESYTYGRICIRVWVEGTDGDCFNNIFNDTVRITLLFQQKDTTSDELGDPGEYDMETLEESVAAKKAAEDAKNETTTPDQGTENGGGQGGEQVGG